MFSFSGYLKVATFSQHWLRDTEDTSGRFAQASAVKKRLQKRGLFDGDRKTSCESMLSDIVKNRYSPSARLQLITFQTDTASAFDILDQE
jgi:hypothetical protein